MRNRAKCKKCNVIIESVQPHDWVYCECNEVGVSGGKENYRCFANDFSNFLRVDDYGNEILVKIEDAKKDPITPKELLNSLDEMIKSIEALPSHAMLTSINHYDFASALILLSAILRSFCKEES